MSDYPEVPLGYKSMCVTLKDGRKVCLFVQGQASPGRELFTYKERLAFDEMVERWQE